MLSRMWLGIYARLAKKQPGSGELSADDDKAVFDDWEVADQTEFAERINLKK